MTEINNRLCNLEEKFVFQERMIDELNDVIIAQQNQIDRLEEQLELLERKLTLIARHPAVNGEPPPPHY